MHMQGNLRLEVGEDSLEIVCSFRYLGDVISSGGEVNQLLGIEYLLFGVSGGNWRAC